MKPSTFGYCIKQGLKNICRNIRFSLASMATISACIFLFCLFFSIIANLGYIVRNAETNIGITVLFREDLGADRIKEIGDQIGKRPEVKELKFTSAEEAWNSFKEKYFEGREDLAAGFEKDNPLAGSASYSILLNDISAQGDFAEWLKSIDGVRQVNYSSSAVAGLSDFNSMAALLSGAIILVLLLVAVFLISNTVSVTAAFRKSENEIMRLIGATNGMIRAPFVIEGTVIGLVGSAVPLVLIFFLYAKVISYLTDKFRIMSDLFRFLPIGSIFPYMAGTALLLGTGVGFIVSFFTIRKHLRV
jgi:cell division transport system permease protein